MAKQVSLDLPCPYCPYLAFNQTDLENHQRFSHGAVNPAQPPATPVPPVATSPAPAKPAKAPAKPKAEAPAASKPAAPAEAPAAPPVAMQRPAEAVKDKDGDSLPAGIFIPKPQPDFWVSEAVVRELFVVDKIATTGEPVNIKVVGPAGVGKTSLAWEFAAAKKRPCFEVHFGMYSDPSEIWGRDRLSMEKGTFYETARLVDAIETPNCVVVCDEPNRCHPEVLNNLFALWDWRRAAYVPALQRMVKVAPGVVFFAAMNEGSEYMGTNPLDRAIRERFTRTIRLKWPPAKAEAKIIQKRTGVAQDIAEKLAKFAADVRRNPKIGFAPSTRQLLVAAQDVSMGLPLPEAVQYALINDLGEGVDRTALLQHLQVIGKVTDAYMGSKSQEEDE